MIKTDKHIKAIRLRDKYKFQLIKLLHSQCEKKPNKREFPVYFDNWKNRLLQLEYYIIDCKYKTL